MQKTLNRLVHERFPPLVCAFGYGSGIFQQQPSDKPKMVDILVVVESAKAWHKENLALNPKDYSFLPRNCMTPRVIEVIQETAGGVWFNTLIPCPGIGNGTLKYGVVSAITLESDLRNWDSFYLAGRLQKPVMEIIPPSDEIHNAMHMNRKQAYVLATLICRELGLEGDIHSLFRQLVGLSYQGDVRMGVAESPTKVNDIVEGSFQEMLQIYSEFNTGQSVHISDLPEKFRNKDSLAEVQLQLKTIIQRTSFLQTMKSALTAGAVKSIRYSVAKLEKKWR